MQHADNKKDFPSDSSSSEQIPATKENQAATDRARKLAELQSNMADFLVERFDSNMKAFKQYLPDIARTFSGYKPIRSMEFFCLENGVPNMMYVDNQDIFYKAEDPSELCKHQVENAIASIPVSNFRYRYEPDPIGQLHHRYITKMTRLIDDNDESGSTTLNNYGILANCVILGVGLGYHIGYLYEKAEISNCIIIEPDRDLFFASLHTFDWANLLKYIFSEHLGICFEIGEPADKVFEDLYGYYEKRGQFLASLGWTFIHYSSLEVSAIAKMLVRDNFRNYSAMGYIDDHLFATSHAVHAILNHAHFIRKDMRLPEKWRNAPVFVVGNGPSLDNDIKFLRKYQDKAIIIACGTAFDSLYHAGIQPDFYGCTERTPQVAQTIRMIPDKEYVNRTILLASDSVHPDTLACFKNNALFYKPDEPFMWLAKSCLKGDYDKISEVVMMTPLVGNFGASAAASLGFKSAYLFGYDNGKKVGAERMHSSFSDFYGSDLNREKGGNYVIDDLVPGNFGGKCISGNFYEPSIRNLEFLFQAYRGQIKFYNCSDGARISGAAPVHSENLNFDNYPDLDKEEFRKYIQHELTTELTATNEAIKAAIDSKGFNVCMDYLKNLFDIRPEKRSDFIDILRKSSEYITKLNLDGRKFFTETIYGSLQSSYICILTALYVVKDEAKCIALANKIIDIYIHYLEDSKLVYSYLPDYTLGRHQELMNHKVGRDYDDDKAPVMPEIYKFTKIESGSGELKKFTKLYK